MVIKQIFDKVKDFIWLQKFDLREQVLGIGIILTFILDLLSTLFFVLLGQGELEGNLIIHNAGWGALPVVLLANIIVFWVLMKYAQRDRVNNTFNVIPTINVFILFRFFIACNNVFQSWSNRGLEVAKPTINQIIRTYMWLIIIMILMQTSSFIIVKLYQMNEKKEAKEKPINKLIGLKSIIMSDNLTGKFTHITSEKDGKKMLKKGFDISFFSDWISSKPQGAWLSWNKGWEEWSQSNQYYEANNKKVSLNCSLKNIIVWRINSMKDFKELWTMFCKEHKGIVESDMDSYVACTIKKVDFWKWIKSLGINAIALTSKGQRETKINSFLYNWSCASLCVLDPKNIIVNKIEAYNLD